MKTNYFILIPVFSIFCLTGCNEKKTEDYKTAQVKTETSDSAYVERGKYLVNAIGCGDCHSPKRMGAHGPEAIAGLEFSGYQAGNPVPEVSTDAFSKGWMLMNADLTAAAGPWGISYAANLTPADNGIGTWNLEQFKRALREGKFKGLPNGRMLLPPMPWENFGKLNDEDIKAIFSYLKSVPPVDNAVPAPTPPAQISPSETRKS